MKTPPFLIIIIMILGIAACGRINSDEAEVPDTPLELYVKSMEKNEKESPLDAEMRHFEDTLPIQYARGGNNGNFAQVFNDSNYRQYYFAEKYGIKPIESLGDAYFTSLPLVTITSNKNYFVEELTHSFPYLVPKAADLLEDIGSAFTDSLRKKGGAGYRIIVTSLLRTPSTVKSLRRVNVNSTDSSCHKFGTTFDLSRTRFMADSPKGNITDADLKNILAGILLDMRRKERCMVKYEHKTNCFHITVTK